MNDFWVVQVTEFDTYAVANTMTYAPRRLANFSATLCPRERMEEAPSRRIGTDRRGGMALDITDKHRSGGESVRFEVVLSNRFEAT
jgi:hypothetical protein